MSSSQERVYQVNYKATEVDGGFAIEPKRDCPHVHNPEKYLSAIYPLLSDEKLLAQFCDSVVVSPCMSSGCGEDKENWLCLSSGKVYCSRYKNGHMAKHCDQETVDNNNNCLAVSFCDLSFWCYKCDSYITDPSLGTLCSKLFRSKEKHGQTPQFLKESVQEYFDSEEKIKESAKIFVQHLRSSKHVVVYTGAGISTSAQIPDYRGPNGIWTLRDQGRMHEAKRFSIEQAYPTYAHYALTLLLKKGMIKRVVTTNVDGLHRRSGTSIDQLSELHGNCYREVCNKCGTEYLRGYDVTKTVVNYTNHLTGRLCTVPNCGGQLKDTIIHFTEQLSPLHLNPAEEDSEKAELTLVMGTSMKVEPACSLPTLNPKAKMFIVNLQKTPFDRKAKLVLHSRTDEFMKCVMEELDLHTQVDQTYDALAEMKNNDQDNMDLE